MKVPMHGIAVVKWMIPEQDKEARGSIRMYSRALLGYPVTFDTDTLEISVLTPEGNLTTFGELIEGCPYVDTTSGYEKKYSVTMDVIG